MKFLVFGLILAVVTVGIFEGMKTETKRVAACTLCYQDVTAATYLAFITLDCDGLNETHDTCVDDFENVNMAPTFNAVSINHKGNVIVTLTIVEISGARDDFTFTFNKEGLLLS